MNGFEYLNRIENLPSISIAKLAEVSMIFLITQTKSQINASLPESSPSPLERSKCFNRAHIGESGTQSLTLLLLLLKPLLLEPKHGLLLACYAHLVDADPFSPDGPRCSTFVILVIPRKMAVFDQAPSGMTTGEMDDFVLVHHLPSVMFGSCSLLTLST